MGAFQLPDSVLGDAFACLVYSFLCLFANCLLVWLIWTHHERTSCELLQHPSPPRGSPYTPGLAARLITISLAPHRCRLHRVLHTLGYHLEHRPTVL